MNDEKCRFFADRKYFSCNILTGTKCDGENTECSFYKTDEQYYNDLNRSILINRMKGNCMKCKYTIEPCKLCDIKGRIIEK